MNKIPLFVLRFYKKAISVSLKMFFGDACRYYPSCSKYAHDAIEIHGLFKGGYLSIKRILSCNYLSRKGFVDPVPAK
jgi:uncharacterized protein